MSPESELNTPPIGWYAGIAFPEEGIRMIFVGSDSFYALHWDLYNQMWAWGHSQGTHDPESVQLHKEYGAFVEKVTGFTPEVLMNYKDKLEEIYCQRSMGPFPFPVNWIEK